MASNTTETRRPDKRQADAEAQRREPPRVSLDVAPVRGRPANENDPGTSMMLARLRRQPSYAPYFVAFFLLLPWVAGWFYAFSNTLMTASGGLLSPANLPATMQAFALLVLPIFVIWVTAYFLWRAAQLRQVSEVLMQSALRLIRPQDIATEGLTTIAQAVRSEVDLLVGGVEHAVQRASVLEEIVHKEISAIERAFGGNEDRIRSLVTGIENQRTALHQAGLIINNDANPLLTRLEANTQNLDSIIGNAHATLVRLETGLRDTTATLAQTIDGVSGRAVAAGEEISSQTSHMERMSGLIVGELRDFSRHLAGQIDQLSQTATVFNSESTDFSRNLLGMETSVVQSIRQSVDHLSDIHQDIARTVERASVASADQMKQTTATLTEVIETTSSNMSYHLKATSGDVATTIERAGIDASQQIDQSRTLVTQGLQNVATDYLDKVAKSRADLVSYLDNSSDNIAGAITQAADSVAGHLNAANAQFLANIDQTSNSLLTQLNATGSGLAGRVEQTTGKLFVEIGTRAEHIIAKLDDSAGLVFGRLDDQANFVTTRVEDTANRILTSIEDRTKATAGKVGDTAHQILAAIDEQNNTSAVRIAQSATQVQSVIGEAATLLANRLDDTSNLLIGRMEGVVTAAAGLLDETAGQVLSEIDRQNNSSAARIVDSAAKVQSAIGDATISFTARLDKTSGLLVEQLEGAISTASVKFDETARRFQGLVGGSAEELESRIDGAAERLYGHMNATITSVTGKIDTVSSAVHGRLDQTSAGITSQLQAVSSTLNDLLVTTSGTIASHLKETSGIVNRQMQDSGIALASNIENSGGVVTEKLISVSGNFVQNVGMAREELLQLLTRSATEVTSRLQDTTTGMTGQIEQTAQKLYHRLDEASAHMSDELEQTAMRINEQINATTDNVTGKVSTVTGKLTVQLDESSKQLGTLLDTTAERLGTQLDQTSTELAALFNANTKMMTEQLDSTASEVTNAFADTAVRVTRQVSEANTLIAQRLEKTSAEVTSQLDTAGNSMFAKIDITARDLGQRFDVATGLLERVTGDISGKLAGTGAKFAELIDTASTQIIADLGKASDTFSQGLNQTTLQITGRLEQDTGLVVGQIDRAAKELETSSVMTASKLDEAHRKFSRHVETANTYLADQLQTAATAIDERLEGISMNLTGKLELTGSRVSERLEDVSQLVERSLEKFNDEMERVLVTRKDQLDHLVADANKRAGDVDAVMTNYMNLIEESLAASEAKSKDISRIIAEQTAQATSNLEQEIRKLEASSGGQITQASRILRDQHERAMAAMNEMMSATATDFQQTAQDMRITAQQVVKDIDQARIDLKRAMLDLPEETRTNADAMRRVVTDQIAALNALADVVKRQTGTLDLSGPGISLQRSYRDPSPGKSEGATVQAPQTGSVSAQKNTISRSERDSVLRDDTLEQTKVLRGKILADLARSTEKIIEPAKAAPVAPAPIANSLAGMPREMEVLVDKIHASARDLVEAIDGILPRDLEKIFAGGERGVYTRRLFESRGKRPQMMIASRYGKEPLVRGRIDSYIRLFERLLDMMSSAPKGENMVEACLASESGKIYLMLAEAAGRIPAQ